MLDTLLWISSGILLYLYGAASAFVWMDKISHGRFLRVYLNEPWPIRTGVWVGWPVFWCFAFKHRHKWRAKHNVTRT